MKLYIAGPMRGYPDFNFPAFFEAEEYARSIYGERDLVIFNPARRESLQTLNVSGPMPIEKYMAIDLPEVCEADQLWLLPGWELSQGATIELEVAKGLRKEILFYDPEAPRGRRLSSFPSEPHPLIVSKVESAEPAHITALREAIDEPNRHPSSKSFLRVVLEAVELHDLKQRDYGTTDDPFANIRSSTGFGVPAWVGSEIRCHDKTTRIQSFLQKGSLANESLRDSLIDKVVYSLISLALYDEENEVC